MGNKGVFFGGILVVGAAAVIGVRYLHLPAPAPTANLPVPAGESSAPAGAGAAALPAPPVDLQHSDAFMRGQAKNLSSNPGLTDWLKIDDIIRRLTAAAAVVAEGKSPRDSLKFLRPKKKFSVKKKGGQPFMDPRSYSRYDLVGDVFQSLNAQAVAGLLKQLDPLFQAANNELGNPNPDFHATLLRAIQEVLRAPVVERDIPLREKVISYAFLPTADMDLEGLSAAQKHLLRMGPKNTAKIQDKLKEIARAMGVAGDQLPQAQVYLAH